MKCILSILSIFFLCIISEAQTLNTDTAKEKPVQYRRGVYINNNYQSYRHKYFGKNLTEEKKRAYPLNYSATTDGNKLSKATAGTGTWTELNPKVPRVDYVGVYFMNKNTGWACGNLGTIIKTTDGGESWKVIPTNTTKPILKVRSYNGKTVIASGYDGLLLRSTDGGETFKQIDAGLGSKDDLWGLEMVNDTLGWACGANKFIKTTDDGVSWQLINTPGYTGNLWWVDFLNENYGFIAADGKVLRTTDGGESWEVIQAGDDQPLYSIDIIDSSHIAAAGYGGTNYSAKNIYSSDGGFTWINGDTLTTEPINCVKYISQDTGYIVMNNVPARKTTNRGREWLEIQGISDNYELQLLNDKMGYSVGSELKINKTENGYENWQRLIINDNFSDVFFINEQKGFAISSFGFAAPHTKSYGLYETTDGGIKWEKVNGAQDGVDLLFLDSLTGFIGSDTIYKTTDGGFSWYVPHGGNDGASKMFFINKEIGWAIRSNVIYKTTDKGENWFKQFSAPLSTGFYSIYFVDSLYGWTANTDRPFKTTDGGKNWIQQVSLDIWFSRDLFFIDHQIGFLLESNKLYRTSDEGITWTQNQSLTGFSIARFSSYKDSMIFIIGYKTFLSLDRGESWNELTELNGTRITSINLLTPGLGFAVGDLGLVLKYYNKSLPVEIYSFNLTLEKSTVTLNWSTATETNNRGFFVERKKQNENAWISLTFIKGSGTSTSIKYYSYKDILNENGDYLYRLKQIDYNGEFQYSNEKKVQYINKINPNLSQNYPNPFNPETNIEYTIPTETFVNISVYDVIGRKVCVLVNEKKQAGNL